MVFEARLATIAAAIEAGEWSIREHAFRRMRERGITTPALRGALTAMDTMVIENYPDDEPRPSCLVLSWIGGRPLHIVITYPPEPDVITVYRPDDRPHEWDATFRSRAR